LAILFSEPERKFYVNELIRKTGAYPNSIQKSLESLQKQKILISSRQGRLRFYELNKANKLLSEIEKISGSRGIVIKENVGGWVKIMNRNMSIPSVIEVARGNLFLSRVINYQLGDYWYNSKTGGVYFNGGEMIELGRHVAGRVKKDIKYASYVIKLCRQESDDLVSQTKGIGNQDLPRAKKSELQKILACFQKKLQSLMPFMVFPHSLERYIQGEIENELKKTLQNKNLTKEFDKYLEILNEPIEQGDDERNSALRIASYVKQYSLNKKARTLILKHTQSFAWLPFWGLETEPFDEDYFTKEIQEMSRSIKSPLGELNKDRRMEEERRQRKLKLLKEIGASSYLEDLVNLLQSFIFLRTYRNNAIRQANFYHLPLIHEIAFRMEITEKEIKYLTYDEMLNWLRYGYGRKFSYSHETLEKEIGRRKSGWAVLMWRGKIRIITGVEKIIETMERYRIVAPTPAMGRVVKGSPACRGKVTGRVKVVRKLSELNKVENGDVLVAKMTTPDYMMAIHKAVAIVTDEGGVTCHAAIVSREFNLPCIVGTRNATQTLSDGDIVEVDADNGVVRVVEDIEVDENIKEIFGKTAYKGKVKGPVRIVFDAGDFAKVQEGDILVAPQTTPEYLSTLYKVKGFVVDEDSLTSHAMLYANALKLPSLIGTNFARNVLQDGEMVELNATGGYLKRL